jgi:sec-independent protein translocase protein TatA
MWLVFGNNSEKIMFANLGTTEIILILAVVLIFFGAKRLPELAKGLGKGISEFKKGMKEVTDEAAQPLNDITSQLK